MDRHWAARELGHFLRTRRERLDHTLVGEVSHIPRRKDGLRRTELAALAGVSSDYYARLEQGRAPNPSDEVLAALAGALDLNNSERFHLRALAERTRTSQSANLTPIRASKDAQETVIPFPESGEFSSIMSAISGAPAMVLNHRLDVLAWNPLAAILVTDFAKLPARHRNTTWQLFTNPEFKARYSNWETVARQNVAFLRASYGRHGDDEGIERLVGVLSARSSQFQEWWAAHDVEEKSSGTKSFVHPAVGRLDLQYQALRLPGTEERHLVLYAAEPMSVSADKVQLLRTMETLSRRPSTAR